MPLPRASVRLRLSSQVCAIGLLARGGKTVRSALIALLHVLGAAGLIAFDGEEEIGAWVLPHDPGCGALSRRGVGGDQRACDLRPAEPLLGGGDFVGSFGHRLGPQPTAVSNRIGANHLQALTVEQLLAVHGDVIAFGITACPTRALATPAKPAGASGCRPGRASGKSCWQWRAPYRRWSITTRASRKWAKRLGGLAVPQPALPAVSFGEWREFELHLKCNLPSSLPNFSTGWERVPVPENIK